MRKVKPMARYEARLQSDGCLRITFSGEWKTGMKIPSSRTIHRLLAEEGIKRVSFDTRLLGTWDSSFVVFLSNLARASKALGVPVEEEALPRGARRLLSLSRSAPPTVEDLGTTKRASFLHWMGEAGTRGLGAMRENLHFLGELAVSAVRMITGSARVRTVDIFTVVGEVGWKALPIVSLISLLVGLILAFVGAVQLRLFGAQIYIADLVAVGMAREMGALMTGVIMAGRTGAAFAANLGTMQVNEEIDALTTFGVSPVDFLVLPRMIALVSMMPLLCVYSIFMGLVGGAIVGVTVFDIAGIQYLEQTRRALTFSHLGVGIGKSLLFGFIVAFCGCSQGLRCGRSAAAVGNAATTAVVTSIVYIVVTDGICAVLTDALGV